MKEDNNICIIGKNIDTIQKELNLSKEKYKKWNFIHYKLNNIDNKEESQNISEELLKSLESIIDKDYSNDSNEIFSYTIIYSLNNFKENNNEKEFIKKIFTDIFNLITSNFFLPFFIFLSKDEQEKDEFNKFLEIDEIKKIDKRNICCFILNEEKKFIKKKIFKIYSFFLKKEMSLILKKEKLNYIKSQRKLYLLLIY